MKKELLISLLFAALGIGFANEAAAEFSMADCEAQIVANKNLQILKGKIDLLNTANQPTEILANSKVPSRKEKVALALWVEEQKRCSAPGIEYHKSQSPEIGAIFDRAYSELFLSAADLYQGKITYGDFARATVRRHQEVREQIAGVVARFREQQAERERQEAIAKQQRLDQQNYQHQQMCESLKQQILVAANSGPTPYQVQKQQQMQMEQDALAMSQMSSAQAARYNYDMAGGQIGRMLSGGVNPAQEAAQQRQAALMQQVEIYKRDCQN